MNIYQKTLETLLYNCLLDREAYESISAHEKGPSR
jgi:hypothetical protein